jgi:hypothetical protein
MQRRLGRIFLLLFVTAWFGVAAPLHPRGVVTMGGAAQPDHKCCPSKRKCPEKNTPRPAVPCAICHFLATLDIPVAFSVHIAPLGLTDIRRVDAPEAVQVAVVANPTSERGPPIV